jgi:malate dehydrogenase
LRVFRQFPRKFLTSEYRVDIAIIGANGDVGRQLAVQIIARQLLSPRSRLQLVGRRDGASHRALHGFRADLYDAFAEITPEIDVALTPEEVAADLILFCAGRTAPTTPNQVVSRQTLARENRMVFERYAEVIAARGNGQELVVMVTNPVELGVEVFARHLGRRRVIGMGAYQDSMRLRREIASDFGVRRQRVHAYMLGEHGDALVPILSQLWIYGFDEAENAAARALLCGARQPADFAPALAEGKRYLGQLLANEHVQEAFRHAEAQPPDLRAVLLPLITHISGAKTAVSTAAVTTELVEQLLNGGQSVIPAQIRLEAGDWDGPPGVLGLPVICGLRGWSQVTDLDMTAAEHSCLRAAAAAITARLSDWAHD